MPTVFNMALEKAIEDFGVEKNEHSIRQHVVSYADDLVVVGRYEEAVKVTFINIVKEAQKIG